MRPIPVHMFAIAAIVMVMSIVTGCSVSGSPLGGQAAHGRMVANKRCAACHAADGNSTQTVYPRLAGQNADYLYQQLASYRSGARHSAVMTPVVAPLTDNDLRDVAAYYAGQRRAHDPAGPADLMAEGRRIFLYGTPDGRVTACASCHAPGQGRMGGGMGMGHMHMRGMMGGRNAPSLYGQHAAYLVAQLQAFAHGTRPSMMMGSIASAMTSREAKAVSDYLAAHP